MQNSVNREIGSGTPSRWARLQAMRKALPERLRRWWSQSLFPATSTVPDDAGAFWKPLLLVALVAGALLFPRLSYPLVEPDEGRYAELGREMLDGGDWLVPRLQGEPYNDKPPLLYWLVAACLGVFGPHPWAARLVPTLAAFFTVLATFLFGRRLVGPRAALFGALGLILTAGFLICGRFLVIDGLLTLVVVLSLFTGYEATCGRRLHWGWWIASALCCGLGLLAKGPVALVLAGPPLAANSWLRRSDAVRLRLRHWFVYGLLATCVAAPWYIAVTVRDPAFAYDFFIEHHLARFFGKAYHEGPMWFYLPVLLVGCLPWSGLLWPLSRFLFSRKPEARAVRSPGMGFCLLCVVWCMLFFSLSRCKLPTYILPALPVLALLVGAYLAAVLSPAVVGRPFHAARGWIPRGTAAGLCCAGVAASVWSWRTGLLGGASTAVAVLGMLAAVGCVGAVALWGKRLSARAGWGLCAVLAFVLLGITTQGLVPAWSARRSPLASWGDLGKVLQDGQTGLACVGSEWWSVAFYLCGDRGWSGELRSLHEHLPNFLKRHPRSLIVANDDFDASLMQRVLPAGMTITRTQRSGQVLLYLVEGK